MQGRLLLLLIILSLTPTQSSYLQMPLLRTPSHTDSSHLQSVLCSNQTVNNEAEYIETCYEKDITYSTPFIINAQHYSLSADFTTPFSWIKGNNCKVEGTNKKCHRVIETIAQQFKSTNLKSRLHRKAEGAGKYSAVIEGSSEKIEGQLEKDKNMTFTVKDSGRLNNLLELIMLGLFIYGEKDNLTLTHANYVEAMSISPNLNTLSDGAISLRFDNTAETSFLSEIFTYVQAMEKSVTILLGTKNIITIGDITAKDTDKGYSGIQWIDMEDEENYGRLPAIVSVGFDDVSEDKEEDTKTHLQAIFSLSASYLAFPQEVIDQAILKKLGSDSVCKINNNGYLQCSSTSKKRLQKLMDKEFVISFNGANMILPMKRLMLKMDHGKRAIFNIKRSLNQMAVLGQPVFLEYFMAFDYLHNRVGFSGKRESQDEFLIQVVSLVRFLCSVMVVGCCFICLYDPCTRWAKRAGRVKRQFRIARRKARESNSVSAAVTNSQGYNSLAQTNRSTIFDDHLSAHEPDARDQLES